MKKWKDVRVNVLGPYDWDVERDFITHWSNRPIYNFCRITRRRIQRF